MCLFSFWQPSWISVDFDNWRDWENEEDEGKEEYDRYVDVSTYKSPAMRSTFLIMLKHLTACLWHFSIWLQYSHCFSEGLDFVYVCVAWFYFCRWSKIWQAVIKEKHQIWVILVMWVHHSANLGGYYSELFFFSLKYHLFCLFSTVFSKKKKRQRVIR